jgi:hypothetical protein
LVSCSLDTAPLRRAEMTSSRLGASNSSMVHDSSVARGFP